MSKRDDPNDPVVRATVMGLCNCECVYCGNRDDRLCIDHVVPKAHGGPDHISNYVIACNQCNATKKNMHVMEFIKLVTAGRVYRANPEVKVPVRELS